MKLHDYLRKPAPHTNCIAIRTVVRAETVIP